MAEGDFPDVEGALRTWLRANTAVSTIVGQRVFFGVPEQATTFPIVTVQRVGGTDDVSDAYIDQALIQIDCWGRLYADTDASKKGGDKAGCDALRRAVRSALFAIRGATPLNSQVVAYNAAVLSDPYSPDPANNRPRYVITVQITARAGTLTSA
jgi:hypothetical protein